MQFSYYMPTKLVSGRDCILKNGAEFNRFGRKVLIVTGKSSKTNGALNDVCEVLKANGQDFVIYDKVKSNPTEENVQEGGKLAREFGAELIVAIGGGSPMDAAKVIAWLACGAQDNIFSYKGEKKALPMIHVPTTAGTGSEVTPYAIVTDHARETKTNVSSMQFFPKLAFLDGKYTKSLPYAETVNTFVDAISHAVEGMLSVRAGELSDALAEESLRIAGKKIRAVADYKLTETDRDELLYASSLAGMVIANTGTCAVHGLGYPLTYYHNIPHGRANGLLLAQFLKFSAEKAANRTGRIFKALGIESADELDNLFRIMFKEREKISENLLAEYAHKVYSSGKTKNGITPFTEQELFEILRKSF